MKLPSDQDASGRNFGDPELALLKDVLDSGTLTATKGKHTKALEAEVADLDIQANVFKAVMLSSGERLSAPTPSCQAMLEFLLNTARD